MVDSPAETHVPIWWVSTGGRAELYSDLEVCSSTPGRLRRPFSLDGQLSPLPLMRSPMTRGQLGRRTTGEAAAFVEEQNRDAVHLLLFPKRQQRRPPPDASLAAQADSGERVAGIGQGEILRLRDEPKRKE